MRLMQLFIIFLTFSFIAFSATTPDVVPTDSSSSFSAGFDSGLGLNVNATAILKDGETTTSILKQMLFFVKVALVIDINTTQSIAFFETHFFYQTNDLILFGSDSSPPQV